MILSGLFRKIRNLRARFVRWFMAVRVVGIKTQAAMREARGLEWLRAEWHDIADRKEIERQRQHAADLGYSSLETMIACGEPLLHSTVTETIGTSGDTPDRTSISAFESNIPANPTEPYVGECISTAYDHQSSTVVFNVSNTNSHAITVTVRSGNRFVDDSNWPSAVDSAEEAQSYHTGAIAIETNDVVVEHLESSMSGFNYAVRSDNSNATDLTVRYMVWHSDSGASDGRGYRGNNDSDTTWADGCLVTIHNCLGYYLRRFIWPVDHQAEVYFCTGALDIGSSTRGIYAHDAGNNTNFVALIAKNCAVISYASDYYQQAAGDFDSTNSDYLLSGDTTASSFAATTSWTSVAGTTFFTDYTAPGLDFTPTSDSTWTGVSVSGLTVDIAGTTRSNQVIGCIEIAAAGGNIVPLIQHHRQQQGVVG